MDRNDLIETFEAYQEALSDIEAAISDYQSSLRDYARPGTSWYRLARFDRIEITHIGESGISFDAIDTDYDSESGHLGWDYIDGDSAQRREIFNRDHAQLRDAHMRRFEMSRADQEAAEREQFAQLQKRYGR